MDWRGEGILTEDLTRSRQITPGSDHHHIKVLQEEYIG
jgi:hypothetical protein